ncbi:MAG: hypothetical protein GX139_02440 [Armatimonadetes bacterium]|nr:hypothetical protein [Armatimonadota bacterium]
MNKPAAVVRRDIIASSGPSIYGISRMDKVRSPQNEMFTFLGVCDGIAYVERDDKTRGKAFEEIDSELFAKWRKVQT